MKTDVVIKVEHDGIIENCRVKLDKNKFPYIVINNEKIVLISAKFPRTVKTYAGYLELNMEIVCGKENLETILSNPDLTSDKLNLKQLSRVA